MKKRIFHLWLPALIVAFSTIGFTSCSDDDDDNFASLATLMQTVPTNPLAQKYCSVDGAKYIEEELPESNITETLNIAQTSISEKVGATSTITIESATKLDKFYVAVDGNKGYYEVEAVETAETRSGMYTYYVTVRFAGTSENEFILTIKGVIIGEGDETYITQESRINIELEPVYATTGIVGKWGNYNLIYSPDPEDYEEPVSAETYEEYYANGMAYRYDADYEEDSFSFKYTYNPLTGELTKTCGPNGVIKMGCTITFSADGNTMYVTETYYYDPDEGWDTTYLTKYSLTRID